MKTKKRFLLAMLLISACFVFPGALFSGNLEPPGAPDSTMKTLDQIPPTWSQVLPASERFEDVMSGEAVLDKETGLVWAKNANLFGTKNWGNAQSTCLMSNIGGRMGWRMPTANELASLIDPTQSNPVLPVGHPFLNVQLDTGYWTSTSTYNADGTIINPVSLSFQQVTMGMAYMVIDNMPNERYVWPVRGGGNNQWDVD